MVRHVGSILVFWALTLVLLGQAWATDKLERPTPPLQPSLTRLSLLTSTYSATPTPTPGHDLLHVTAGLLQRAKETWAPRREGLSFLVAPVFSSVTPGDVGVRGALRLRF